MEILHLPYNKIDKVKWDQCILHSSYGSIYATSAYLDHIAGKWEALIFKDYEVVMPLIYKKKFGIKYLYQPSFLPQTGIFSGKIITSQAINFFLREAFSLFRFAEISLTYPLTVTCVDDNMQTRLRNNFAVNLAEDHKTIAENYHPHFSKSLRRLQKLSLQYVSSDNIKEVTELYFSLYQKKSGTKKLSLKRFELLCMVLQNQGNVIIRKAADAEGKLLAAVLLLRFKNRIYNIISCITPPGKKAESNYFLYDKVIEEFSGKGMVLDLEGSDIKGIADFYMKMNPFNEQYPFIKYNNLPGILKKIKK